jgi:hypothetical protein
MKNPLQYVQQYPDRSKRILGIGFEEWESLLAQVKIHALKREQAKEKQKIRINKAGGGRPRILSEAEELCLCVFYLRHFPTFEVLGMQFGVSKTTANEIFNDWLSVLREILPCSLMEQIERAEDEWEIMSEFITEYELIIDSWEQPRERPKDNQKQKEFYSGKKKNHTFKGQVIVFPFGTDVVDVRVGEKGKTSDIGLFREQQTKFADCQKFTGDKGYQGGKNIQTPHKKPKHKELTVEQEANNKVLASNRIFVEHIIRLAKIFRAAKEKYRLNLNKYETIILTIWGLVRLRIGAVALPHSA